VAVDGLAVDVAGAPVDVVDPLRRITAGTDRQAGLRQDHRRGQASGDVGLDELQPPLAGPPASHISTARTTLIVAYTPSMTAPVDHS
jgi:hypothetical protein